MAQYYDEELEKMISEEEFEWSVLSFVSGIVEEFKNTPQIECAIQKILRKIGSVFKADRVYVMLISQDGTQFFPWCQWNRDGVLPWRLDPMPMTPQIQALFRADGLAVYDSLGKAAEPLQALLGWPDPKAAVLQGQLIKNGVFYGWIGVDSNMGQRHWRAQEIELLQTAVMLLRERIPSLLHK